MKKITAALLVLCTATVCTAQINPFKLEGEKPPSLAEIQEAIEFNLNHIKIDTIPKSV